MSGLVPEPLSPATPSLRRSSTPLAAPRTPSASSSASASVSRSSPAQSDDREPEHPDMDACATPGMPPTIPTDRDSPDEAEQEPDDNASSRSAGTPSVQFSLTSSATSQSSAAPRAVGYAMMGLGTRQGEEQLAEALRGRERAWMLSTAEQLERLVREGAEGGPATILLHPASQVQRVLAYKAAQWYGLTASAAETGGGLVVMATRNGEGQSGRGGSSSASAAQGKNPSTLQLAKLVPRPTSPPPPKVTLMKRTARHGTGSGGASDRHSSSAASDTSAGGAPPTLAEREALYQLARERIFKAGGTADDARSRASDTASDTQSVRSGRSSGRRSNAGRGEYAQETVRRSRREALDEEDDFNRTDPRLRGRVQAQQQQQLPPHMTPGPYVGTAACPPAATMGYPPHMGPPHMLYDQPVYNSVNSASSLDPLAYGDTSHLAYSDASYYYPMGPTMVPVGYPLPLAAPHPEPPFTSCTPTPGHQPLHYMPPAPAYSAPPSVMRHGLMGMPTAQVPTAARLESYLQTSTGPYPPPSNRSAGSPVPSTLDFDGQSTFSESAASVTESSKVPSRTPSRQGSEGRRRDSLGAKSEERDMPRSPTSVHSAPRPTPRFALPPKPTWVTSPTARSIDGNRPISNPAYWNESPRRGIAESSSMPLQRPSPSVSTRSAPASMLGMPTLHQAGRPDLAMRRGESSTGEFAPDGDFVRRGNTVRQGKLYDPSSGKVTTHPVGGKKRAGTITGRAEGSASDPPNSNIDDDIEAKLQALAIVHNVEIGPPPARRR